MSKKYRLSWSHGSFEVLATAGMLTWAEFIVDEQAFRPFAQADWMGTFSDFDLPGHLRELGGEFVGVPFGSSGPPEGMSDEWQQAVGEARNELDHGLSADADWEIVSCGNGAVHMRLEYPASSPIAFLDRHIWGRDGVPVLDFRLDVTARRPTSVSIGLHPIFRLPKESRALGIDARFAKGLTYPGIVPAGKMVTLPGCDFRTLCEVPGPNGAVDFSRLPFDFAAEDNLQLCAADGRVVLTYLKEGMKVTLDWDREVLPSVMLWLSDRGAKGRPFLERYRGLGVEPIAAAFDLADTVSISQNPINLLGVRTAVPLRPEEHSQIAYSISVSRH